jgi:hypothetical protein
VLGEQLLCYGGVWRWECGDDYHDECRGKCCDEFVGVGVGGEWGWDVYYLAVYVDFACGVEYTGVTRFVKYYRVYFLGCGWEFIDWK